MWVCVRAGVYVEGRPSGPASYAQHGGQWVTEINVRSRVPIGAHALCTCDENYLWRAQTYEQAHTHTNTLSISHKA